ncbi:hypothetical protein GS501_04595 [Saccharibacter sp. 17.LH.SD]|uniref:hypothetical protein n=1 Tax=Saccharibacter sp. 17.LH.SD TaxID=2689393 RepID=UPI00136C0111|nr:hypothetical protein [Saccharibacter sp. 17.LH.SD]MXV44324.1 hypothetical protein [Saccharibacter sp. 17.LH.SD]
MSANPATPQGMLNRLRGSIVFPDHSSLNITSDFLAQEGISVAPEGNVTDMIETLTGRVGSPAAKQNVNVTINLNRAQALANEFFKQIKKNTYIGQMRIISDSPVQDDRTILNCFIMTQPEQALNGTQARWNIVIAGYEIVNSDMWSLS